MLTWIQFSQLSWNLQLSCGQPPPAGRLPSGQEEQDRKVILLPILTYLHPWMAITDATAHQADATVKQTMLRNTRVTLFKGKVFIDMIILIIL
jgi:hypothetical protein